MCSSIQLKISKRKAYVSAFFYANFLTITNTVSNIIIAQKMIDETLLIIIITKLTTIVGELLIIRYLARTLKAMWYQSYWLTIVLHIILTLPMIFYTQSFVVLDSEERIIFQGVTLRTLPLYLLSIGLMLITYLLVWILCKYIIKRIDLVKISKKFWVVIYTIWASITLLTTKTYQYTSDETSQTILGMDNYREMIIGILVIIFCIAVSIIHSDKKILKVENSLLKEQYELQFANYMAMQQKELEIHKLYHDIGNHVKTIQILVNQGDTQEAKEYTLKLSQQYQNIRKGLYCNNKVINAVLIQKLKVCEENSIRYEMDLAIPKTLSIQDIDLMCIYSNLLDNAIESCQRDAGLDDYIKIKTSQVGNYLGIKITNSKKSEQSEHLSVSEYGTTKKDKSMHGYGLRIIDEIVKRYDGYKELQDNNGEFSAMVMLKLKPAVDEAIAAL
jgi:hypothetical protein